MSWGCRSVVVLGLLSIGSLGAGCGHDGPPGGEAPTSAETQKIVAVLRARPASPMVAGVARGFRVVPGGLSPRFEVEDGEATARVVLPARLTAAAHLEDAKSGLGIDISLSGARDVAAQAADGYVAYPHALDSGATVLHRALPMGTEDFVSFESRPSKPEIAYGIDLGPGVSGLRLVAGTLEMLDAEGAPRLRVAPPYIVGADGVRTDATLTVERCEVYESAAAPWGRPVTAPGGKTCTVRVSWDDGAVVYPAVLDPRWTTTGSMTVARQDHTATLLSTGKVLVAGGRSTSTGTTGLASAELYDRTTGTWAATGSMTGGRWSHTATQLNTNSNTTTSGKVLISGGLNGTTSQNTAQLYSPTAGTWTAAANLNAARHLHSATLLPSGNVLVAGGLSGTTVLNTAAIYNPASGTGTWTAVATNMASARRSHTATLLTSSNASFNNKVLIAGGNSGGTTSLTSVQLFDATALTWSTTTALATAREGQTATTLTNGNVLLAGGKSGTTTLGTAFVFTIPASGTAATWVSAGTMTALRSGHTATLLPSAIVKNGQVLVAGGSNGTSTLGTAELWNGTSTWTATTALTTPVQGQTATLLSNNMVLLAGGTNGTTTVATASLYDPSFSLACTSNSQCASGFCTNGVCCDTACNGGCGACNLTGKVGTCSAATSGTVCRAQNGACDIAETCNGTSLICPTDGFASATTVCRASAGVCDVAEKCTGTSATCPPDGLAPATTFCGLPIGTQGVAATCTGTSATCPESNASEALGFESASAWSFSTAGTVVGVNANHTQGSSSLEVAAQNYAPLTSVPLSSIGSVGPLVLLDFMLPTAEANPTWYGNVQMYVSSPSLGISNVFLGQVELTGLPLAQWQTLAFHMPVNVVAQISAGGYSDLTFEIAINVPYNETGHYLLDNLRLGADVIPTLLGIATNSAGATEAIFTYTTTSVTNINIPYGPSNSLSDQNGFIAAPPQFPPQWFVAAAHPPFVAPLSGAQLTWTIEGSSATATAQSTALPVQTLPDGSRAATLPNGTAVNLDTGPVAPLLDQAIVASDTSYTTADKAFDARLLITPNSINMIGPTSAGTAPGTFRVTDDGAAEYVYPIVTPPGRNGVEPRLSLVYNSRTGDGFLGPGWSLHGLHRIARCKVPYGVANERGEDPAPVTYTFADDFCFDGERLISIGGNVYKTKRDQWSKFVPIGIDADGPTSFQVFRKDGLVETYAQIEVKARYTSLSGTAGLSSPATQSALVRVAWLLTNVSDRYGNQMAINYITQADTSEILPSLISYTSNSKTGQAATKSIQFDYNFPKSSVLRFQSGVATIQTATLVSLTISAPNPVSPSIVSSYKFAYTAPSITGRYLLSSAQRCASHASECMAPTIFAWEHGSYGFNHVVSTVDDFHCATCSYNTASAGVEGASRIMVSADVNGDGLDDLIYRSFEGFPTNPTLDDALRNVLLTSLRVRLSSGGGFGTAQETGLPINAGVTLSPVPIAFDINDDGKADLAIPQVREVDAITFFTQWRLFQSEEPTSSAFAELPLGLTGSQYLDPTLNPEAAAQQQFGSLVPADINGDGLIDLSRSITGPFGQDLGLRLNVNGTLLPSYVTAVRSDGSAVLWGAPFTSSFPSALEQFAADIDGDGRTEIVMAQHDGTVIGVRSGITGTSTISTNMPLTACQARVMDLNGDGLMDIVRSTSTTNSSSDCSGPYDSWINTGNGFYLAQQNLPQAVANVVPAGGDDPMTFVVGFVSDINGDGLDDVMVPGCTTTGTGPTATAYLSRGDGGFTAVPLNIPPGLGITTNIAAGVGSPTCQAALMDVDGDGQKDLVQPEFGSNVLHIYFRNGKRPDRLIGIKNGIGATVSVEYSRYDGSKFDTCGYPHACGGRNVEVVSDYTVDEGQVVPGQSGTTQYTMTYSGARADAMGAGWLGFESIQRRDDRTGAVSSKTFDLDTQIGNWYPFVGLPKTETVQVQLSGSGRTITRTRQTGYIALQSDFNNLRGPYSVQPLTIDEQEFEFQGPGQGPGPLQRSTHQIFGYDGAANVISHETIGNITGTDDLVTYSVTNDEPNWLLNEVTQVKAVSKSATGEVDQRITTFQIDSTTGSVSGETVQPGDPQSQLIVTYGRNLGGLIASVTETPISGAPRTNLIGYDQTDGTLPATYTNPAGQVTRVAYHPGLGVLAGTVDPNNVTTQWQYDGFGRARTRVDATGMTSQLHYSRPDSSLGMIVSWSDSTGRSGATTYDDLTREISRVETAFDGSHQRTVNTSYDAVSGRPGIVSRPFGAASAGTVPVSAWTFGYDEIGRLVSAQPPNEALRTVTYQGLTSTDFVAGVKKGYHIEDGMGHVVQSASINPASSAPNGAILTTYDYGPFGNLRHVYEPGDHTVVMSYDHLGRRIEINDPDAGDRITQYSSLGEVAVEQLPGQSSVIYSHDGLGRVALIQQGGAITQYNWDTAPNGLGKLGSETSPSGVSTAFAYQPNGLTQSTAWAVENAQFTFNWGYDASGRPQTITYPDIGVGSRFAVAIGYGADGRVGALTLASGGPPLWQKGAVADDGQTSLEAFADGLSTSHDTDPVTGRLTHVSTGSGATVPAPDGGRAFQHPIQSLGYTYYADGKLQGRTDFGLGAAEGFAYDNLDRVTTWSLPSQEATVQYSYDDAGNLIERQRMDPSGQEPTEIYQYGQNGAGPHALTTGPAGTYGYDLSGRQTSRPGQPSLTYTYFDLPTQVSISGGTPATFGYDAEGVRVVKTTATSDVVSLAGLYERRIQNGVTTHVFYLPGDGRIVGQVSCDSHGACGSPAYFDPDNLGTIDTVESGGTVLGVEKRDPFGRSYIMTSGVMSPPSVTFGFIGEGEDSETGLVNLNHRLYDAQLGRFISPDPLVKDAFSGQAYNRYAYAGNNPLSFVDPTGLQSVPPDDPTAPPIPVLDPLNVNEILDSQSSGSNGFDTSFAANAVCQVGSCLGMPVDPTALPDAFNGLQAANSSPTVLGSYMPASPSAGFINQTTGAGTVASPSGSAYPSGGNGSNTLAMAPWSGVGASYKPSSLPAAFDPNEIAKSMLYGAIAGSVFFGGVFLADFAIASILDGSAVAATSIGLPAATAAGQQIGEAVRGQLGGKMQAIVERVTDLHLTQTEATAAADAAVRAVGLRTDIIAVGQNMVVSSVQVGVGMPVLVVQTTGVVVRAVADLAIQGTSLVVLNLRGF